MKDCEIEFPTGALLRDPRIHDTPELRVIQSDSDHVVVNVGGHERQYKLRETFLRRWLLPARTVVEIIPTTPSDEIRIGIVIGVCGEPEPKTIWAYQIQTEAGTEQISEHQLRVVKLKSIICNPVERLELNGWRGPRRFFARLRLLERTTIWKQDSEGIPAFLGARLEPLFHQFYAARRCLLDRETRFLLADEVGLGKTIEAGLVIQSLLTVKPNTRILIVSPGTTSRQWLSELYLRFGGRVFTHVDSVRYNRSKKRERELFLKTDHLIVTTSLLRIHHKALAIIVSQKWDLLVVDEGHQLVNWPELNESLRHVSEAASGCLVLTATPGRGDDKGLLEMLKLVAPRIYRNVSLKEFASRLEPQRLITEKLLFSEELVAALLAFGEIEEDDARELAEHWKGIFPNDKLVNEHLARMDQGDSEAAEELVAYIKEHYRVDRRIIRTRRRTLGEYGSNYATRSLQSLEYDPCPAEVAVTEQIEELIHSREVPSTWKAFWSRFVCTTPSILKFLIKTRLGVISGIKSKGFIEDPLAADLGPAEEEIALQEFLSSGPTFLGEELWLREVLNQVERWLQTEEHCPKRFQFLRAWLDKRIRSGHNKIVVFSQSRVVVEELATYLRVEFGTDAVAVMTHNLSDEEISEVSFRFEQRPSCLLLISDEVGAEGRNFQFADAVVHLDQPSVVARIEQRIGRLDRIGRSEEHGVLSVVLTGPFELERAYLKLHRDVFRVYERSIGGLEYLLPQLQQQIHRASTVGVQALNSLAVEMLVQLEIEEQNVDEAFSFFLDTTRPELERAKQLTELVADRTGDEDESFIRDWCKELRINIIPQERNCVKVEARFERLDTPLPFIKEKDWVKTGTFHRSSAIEIPAIQYLAPGHLFVDALLQSARETQDARASAFFRDLGATGLGRVFCVVVGLLGPDETVFQDDLPPGLMRRAEHYLPIEWVRSTFEILPDGQAISVPRGALFDQLLEDFQASDRKCQPDHISQVIERFPNLWAGVAAAVDSAKSIILKQKNDEVEAAADEFAEALRTELAYLQSQLHNSSTPDIIQSLRDRESLLESVRYPSVVTDAVAIVIGYNGR